MTGMVSASTFRYGLRGLFMAMSRVSLEASRGRRHGNQAGIAGGRRILIIVTSTSIDLEAAKESAARGRHLNLHLFWPRGSSLISTVLFLTASRKTITNVRGRPSNLLFAFSLNIRGCSSLNSGRPLSWPLPKKFFSVLSTVSFLLALLTVLRKGGCGGLRGHEINFCRRRGFS